MGTVTNPIIYSVRRLVTLANRHGFYWGGNYRLGPDDIHFEIAIPLD